MGLFAWQDDDLAQELTTLLRHCTNLFAHFNYDTGWPSEAMQREYVASMRDAFKQLRFEFHGWRLCRTSISGASEHGKV